MIEEFIIEVAGIAIKSLAAHGPESLLLGLLTLYIILQNLINARDMKEMITKDIESRDAMTQALNNLTVAVQKRIKRQR